MVSAISTIGVDNLTGRQDIVAVTRQGGFLSAASRRLLEIVRAHYTADRITMDKGSARTRRPRALRGKRPRRRK
ncbi:MAG TPA: hypothetical protein VFL62_05200 [Bradyrhizobium sp.]|uniref:hypothetical protein n=1 Tax=Bradyrhizobium sp. TaxID=376 RepID=UPI002D7F07FD|nr:hypothetical protein [Bradyrhizobium sp.]HET7885605.1 hypothetical protein [Bradyrhizobium sp.]